VPIRASASERPDPFTLMRVSGSLPSYWVRQTRAVHLSLTVSCHTVVVPETAPATLLIAEDDRAVRESLTRALQLEGYSVVTAGDGAEALRVAGSATPDVIVLDVSMPVIDGLTVCKVLRADHNKVPILMLTARTETRDRVAGLDAGADDYVPKPFELDELLARLRALLRRTQAEPGEEHEELRLGDLRLEPASRRAWRGDRELELSKTEFDLLELLLRNQGVVLDHTTIYERIWHYDFGPDSKNLAVYIGYLRRKTEADGEPRLIQTVRGVGYSAREA
jgi:two-component system response regulator MprA